jgi:hypothetical protein
LIAFDTSSQPVWFWRRRAFRLKDLTGGRFKNGAVARILARSFWICGKAPTFHEFASAWLQAASEHTRPNPEWAFLSDRASKGAVPDWKKLRAIKAKKVMKALANLIPSSVVQAESP